MWAIQHFNDQMCPLVSSGVSSWASSQSPHVWQPVSWVTSSSNHLDVFRWGPGQEITPQGCHLPQPHSFGPSESRQASVPGLPPPRHMGLHMQGQAGPLPGHLPGTTPSWLHRPGSSLSHRKLTSNWKQKEATGPSAFYSLQSAFVCMHPIVPHEKSGRWA